MKAIIKKRINLLLLCGLCLTIGGWIFYEYCYSGKHKNCHSTHCVELTDSTVSGVLVERMYFIRKDENWSLSHSPIDVASKCKKMPYFMLYRGEITVPLNPPKSVGGKELASKVVSAIEGYLLNAALMDFKESDRFSDFQKVTLSFRSYNLQIFEPCDDFVLVLAAKHGMYSNSRLESGPIDVCGGGDNFWEALYDLKNDKIIFFSINQPF